MSAGRDLVLLRPRDAEALLSEEEFSHDEFLPYWAELWPSATGAGAGRWARGRCAARGRWSSGAGSGCRRGRGRRRGRARDRHGLGAGLDRDDRAQRRAQRARSSRRSCVAGPRRRRSSRARRGTSCSPSDVLYEARNGVALLAAAAAADRRARRDLARRPRPRGRAAPFLEAGRRGVRDRDPAAPGDPPGSDPPDASARLRSMSTQREKAEELRRLHAAPEPLVLVNAWDAGERARGRGRPGPRDRHRELVDRRRARLRGRRAIPLDDDARRPWRVVARAVELPVTADLERGYGDAGATVARAIEAGAVGCNLEDCRRRAAGWCRSRRTSPRSPPPAPRARPPGVPLVINARTDVFLQGSTFDEARRARPRVPRRGRRLRLRAGRARRGDARAARDQDPRADQRVRRRRRADAGRAGAARDRRA